MPNPPTRWLITGGCGFIGTSLIERLLDTGGVSVRVLDNLSVGTREDLSVVCSFTEASTEQLAAPGGGQVQLVVGDITDAATAAACCAGMDVVVHLAANTGVGPSVDNPRLDLESNVIGVFNLRRRHT